VKLLLDTHALFWWLIDEAQLSPTAYAAIKARGKEVHVSVATAWEMAIKVGRGRWPDAEPLVANFEAHISVNGFDLLSITVAHVRAAGLMQAAHRDPFDRLLAAQAQIEGLTLVTADAKVHSLGAAWLW
jgi:PIN domain nuclease of toxin-antitoxin system